MVKTRVRIRWRTHHLLDILLLACLCCALVGLGVTPPHSGCFQQGLDVEKVAACPAA
jgi:hypothetical protein